MLLSVRVVSTNAVPWSQLQNMRGGMKKQKLDKEKDRDISEKIALGMHKGGGAKAGADL